MSCVWEAKRRRRICKVPPPRLPVAACRRPMTSSGTGATPAPIVHRHPIHPPSFSCRTLETSTTPIASRVSCLLSRYNPRVTETKRGSGPLGHREDSLFEDRSSRFMHNTRPQCMYKVDCYYKGYILDGLTYLSPLVHTTPHLMLRELVTAPSESSF